MLDEAGPSALSLREVARRAGCTHQAPYHYFADREALLAELVIEGFNDLTQGLAAANDLACSRALREVLMASARAYVGFALAQPGVFRIMFRPDFCNPMRFPDVLAAGGRARAELDQLTAIVWGARAPAAQATILWAHVHGLACLLVEGPLAQQFSGPAQRTRHLREVAEHFADQVLGAAARRGELRPSR